MFFFQLLLPMTTQLDGKKKCYGEMISIPEFITFRIDVIMPGDTPVLTPNFMVKSLCLGTNATASFPGCTRNDNISPGVADPPPNCKSLPPPSLTSCQAEPWQS